MESGIVFFTAQWFTIQPDIFVATMMLEFAMHNGDVLRLRGFDITDETFDEINRDLRRLGFSGSKASYELRKICIDRIYQRFGAEKAVSISGDDIRTISRYYADPAQSNIGAVQGRGPDRMKL